jgi:glutamate/aspartate transport system substrate-binding protein
MNRKLYRAFACCALLLGIACGAAADETEPLAGDRLSGTLQRIKQSGVIRLGYRENSIPFAYRDPRGLPVGYSVDLCNAVVEDVVDELGGREIRVEYRPVTPENRFALLASGDIDLECGSTTNNLERRKLVAFSPVTFVTGTRLLVPRDSGAETLRDLRGKTIAVTRGTTNAAAIQALNERQRLGLTIVSGDDHAQAFALLVAGKADALANDDVLLHALVADSRTTGRYKVTGDFLSFDPYGLAFRKDDPQFAQIVERTFHRLAESREIVWIYEKWFTRRLPSGVRLNLPMSAQLQELLRMQGLPGD